MEVFPEGLLVHSYYPKYLHLYYTCFKCTIWKWHESQLLLFSMGRERPLRVWRSHSYCCQVWGDGAGFESFRGNPRVRFKPTSGLPWRQPPKGVVGSGWLETSCSKVSFLGVPERDCCVFRGGFKSSWGSYSRWRITPQSTMPNSPINGSMENKVL